MKSVTILPSIAGSFGAAILASTAAATQVHPDPPEMPASVQEAIGRDLKACEYDAQVCAVVLPSGPERAYRALNRAQGLVADITARGLDLRPAGTGEPAWRLKLTLEGCAGTATLSATGRRVERHLGLLTEWFLNDQRGLEHGVTVAGPPPGGARPLRVDWIVTGSLRARAAPGGDSIAFADAHGEVVLAYDGLKVFDASGRRLPARLELEGSRLSIAVNDAGAEYPVTIDPLFHQAKLRASDLGPYDKFAYACDASGSVVVVGAPAQNSWTGAVYVYERPAGGWVDMNELAKLTASDGAWGDSFGFSVAIDGDTVVVGAYNKTGVGLGAGSAYAFAKPAGGWVDMTESAKLLPSDAHADDLFGYSVDVSEAAVVVGAYGDENNKGSAYVFREPPGGAGRPFLVAHSQGGHSVMSAVERDCDAWAGAIVCDMMMMRREAAEAHMRQRSGDRMRAPAQARPHPVRPDLATILGRYRLAPPQPCANEVLLEYVARHSVKRVDGGWIWKFDPRVRISDGHSAEWWVAQPERFAALELRKAIVYGSRSAIFTDDSAAYLRELTGGRVPVVAVPDAHHHLMLDQPLAFTASLRALLESWTAASP